MADIKEIDGIIFESRCQTIVNTVNCMGVMGKGIALEYKYRYPEMYIAYNNMCQNRLLKPGNLHLWVKSTPWILNFPTKNDWKRPSKIEYIRSGLKKFVATYTEKGITSIAFPRLGTQSGGLSWDEVRHELYTFLEPLPSLYVEIYNFTPGAYDRWFETLYKAVFSLTALQLQESVELDARQTKKIVEAIENKSVRSMYDLQCMPGVGEKSLERLYYFIRKEVLHEVEAPKDKTSNEDVQTEQITLF